MTEEFAIQGLKTLYAHYKNQQFDRQVLADIKADLLQEPDESMVKAVAIVTKNYPTLPDAKRFLGIVRGVSRADNQTVVDYTPTEYGKRSLKLLRAMMSLEHGTPYPQFLIEGALVMQNAYPQHRDDWRTLRQQMISYNSRFATQEPFSDIS